MNTYILVACHDEGIHTTMTTKAETVMGALEGGFDYYPFSLEDFMSRMAENKELSKAEFAAFDSIWPLTHIPVEKLPDRLASEVGWMRKAARARMDDEEAGLPEGCNTLIARQVEEKLRVHARKTLTRYYDIERTPNITPWDEGNYVDGDSNSQRTIFEITPEGKVTSYPGGPIEEE